MPTSQHATRTTNHEPRNTPAEHANTVDQALVSVLRETGAMIAQLTTILEELGADDD